MMKTDLIKAVAEDAGTTQEATRKVIDAFIGVVTRELGKGEKVVITGFGTFEARSRAEREGINPQTRERIRVPAQVVPGFKVSSALKNAVNPAANAATNGTGSES